MKFGRIVPQVNTHGLSYLISDMTSYIQDGRCHFMQKNDAIW